jgi:hypothetical protein
MTWGRHLQTGGRSGSRTGNIYVALAVTSSWEIESSSALVVMVEKEAIVIYFGVSGRRASVVVLQIPNILLGGACHKTRTFH